MGGGITGISCALELADQLGTGVDITLVESEPYLGGKIQSIALGNVRVEAGPDAFLTRASHGIDFIDRLGLSNEMVRPINFSASIYAKGKLHSVPAGIMLGVPVNLGSFLSTSSVLSPLGRLRASLDFFLPKTKLGSDATISSLVRARFGQEVDEVLVDPMIGGINAGSTTNLSLAAVAPTLLSGYTKSGSRSMARSLVSLVQLPKPQHGSRPQIPFASLTNGLDLLVTRAHTLLKELGVTILLDTHVTTIGQSEGIVKLSLESKDGLTSELHSSKVALAIPASKAYPLVKDISQSVAKKMSTIEYAGVAMTAMIYPKEAFRIPLRGSGVLIPKTNGKLITAITFASHKWSRLAIPGVEVLRVSTGRYSDKRSENASDNNLWVQIKQEITEILGATSDPLDLKTHRWNEALPQYRPFHNDLVQSIRAELRAHSGIEICGAAFDGIGIPACIESGKKAAHSLLSGSLPIYK